MSGTSQSENLTGSPSDPTASAGGRLWAEGEFWLRVWDEQGKSGRVVRIPRPFGLIGRGAASDVWIDDKAVSVRHVYLHLDRRGLFAVDLATPSGTRFGEIDQPAGWLLPGHSLTVAGRRIDLVRARGRDASRSEGDAADDGDATPPNLLASTDSARLIRAALYPVRPSGNPWTLDSELVFMGRGACCGVRVLESGVSRIHCALVRSVAGAFVVDLVGKEVLLNDQAVLGGAPLADGDVLALGSTQFRVRLGDDPHRQIALAERPRPPVSVHKPAPPSPPLWPGWPGHAQPPAHFPGPAQDQTALMAWMMGLFQANQAEVLRQQGEFQSVVAGLLQQIQRDQSDLLSRLLERMEANNQELSALREELQKRLGPAAPPVPEPLPLPAPRPEPLKINTAPPPTIPAGAATSWLIDRVHRLEQENRSTWKDLLGRLAGNARPLP